MRCPKCGYISFDNVEKCLKCRKNIAEASSLFQGSVLNVTTPVFLKLVPDEEEVEDMGEMEASSEEIDFADDEIELTDPDLDILLDEEEDTAEVQLELDDGEEVEPSALDDLSEIESFTEDEAGEEEAAPDFGSLDEADLEQAFADEEPDEHVDFADVEVEETGIQPEDELLGEAVATRQGDAPGLRCARALPLVVEVQPYTHCPAHQVVFGHEAPFATVVTAVAVIAHDEVMVLRDCIDIVPYGVGIRYQDLVPAAIQVLLSAYLKKSAFVFFVFPGAPMIYKF